MAFGKLAAAVLLAGIGFGASPALALVAIPEGVPDGSATDQLTVNGTYGAPLPTTPAELFASPNFTLSLTLPAAVTVSAAGPVLSEFGVPVSGSYTDNGQTVSFSNQLAFFGATNTGLPTFPDHFSLIISGLLQTGDSFIVSFQTNDPLFSPTTFVAGEDEIFPLGNLTITDGSAAYDDAPDPPFTGTVSITSLAAVPEPASLSLFLPALALPWLLRRGQRRSS